MIPGIEMYYECCLDDFVRFPPLNLVANMNMRQEKRKNRMLTFCASAKKGWGSDSK